MENKFLFYGPKGCGKSHFAKCCYGEISKILPDFLILKIDKTYLLEDPIKNIKEVFLKLSNYEPNGILIEDIDALLTSLWDQPAATRHLIESIKALGDRQFLIATTRHPEKMDEETLTEFDQIFPFLYPDENDRYEILRVHTQVIRRVHLAKEVDLRDIGKKTSWFSGAELERIIIYARKQNDGQQLNNDLINKAIGHIQASVFIPERIEATKQLVDFSMQHCTFSPTREKLRIYANTLEGLLKEELGSKDPSVDLNKILELKPNVFGIGININEIFETIRRKIGGKKTKKT